MRHVATCEGENLSGDNELDQRPACLRPVGQRATVFRHDIEADIPECLTSEELRPQRELGELIAPVIAWYPRQKGEPLDGRPADLRVLGREVKVGIAVKQAGTSQARECRQRIAQHRIVPQPGVLHYCVLLAQ
jgi:hypothetical protein